MTIELSLAGSFIDHEGKQQDVICARWADGFTVSQVRGREILEDPYIRPEIELDFPKIARTPRGRMSQRPARGWRTALYIAELFIVAVWGLAALAVGVFASWWGALGMFAAFVLGGVFRDFYRLRTGIEPKLVEVDSRRSDE